MLSKKMAFSLTSLITILALAFVAPVAMGGVLGKDFSTTISLLGAGAVDGTTGVFTPTTGTGGLLGDNVTATGTVAIKVTFGKPVASTALDVFNTDATAADDTDERTIIVTMINKADGATITSTVITADITVAARNATEHNLPLGTIPANTLVLVEIAAGKFTNNDPADVVQSKANADDSLGKNAKADTLTFEVVAAPTEAVRGAIPKVLTGDDFMPELPSIVLGPGTHDAFSFKVTLSEAPKEFKKDHIDASNATVDAVIALTPMTESTADISTGLNNMIYPYLVTVKPKYENKNDIVIKIKPFEDKDLPTPRKSATHLVGVVKVNSDANKKVGQSGTKKYLPEKAVIPKDGYLIVAKDKGMSYITDPGNQEHGAADIARRVSAKTQTYNMVAVDLGINLEGFLIRGGTIDLVGTPAGVYISEIMWGTDAGSRDRQWIEIHNMSGAEIKIPKEKYSLMLYEANEVLPDVSTVVDRVSTLYKGTNIWSIAGKGQNGRTVGKITEVLKEGDENVAVDVEIVPTDRLISMERAMATDGTYADGTMADSWAQSMLPAQNFKDAAGGLFVGSPGASAINPVPDAMPEPEPAPPTPVSVAMADDIKITEIMVSTGNGRYPQWIELTSSATGEVSLEGWEMVIDNAIDADVLGGGNAITVSLSGVTLDVSMHEGNLGKGQSALVVAWAAQRMSDNIRADRVVNVATQLGQTRRYQLLSYKGFRITLVPPDQGAIAAFGDIAGNLDEAWELPMDGRSSLIRSEMAAGVATMGTDANGWALASSTELVTGQPSYYGDDEDEGTPGHDSGGPLPVELSHFRPARDKATGAVVITWATQSELNNAGFFIKRSQQRDGEFKVINATMVPGAGTTSEKQFYTYTDTTAQPNIVYYYQIEDVSLDGNRQTLTRGIRLKGHIGAAGKLTSTWGELKSSNE